MGQYEDLRRVLAAVRLYEQSGKLPCNVEDIDTACERILSNDPFDSVGIDWHRIAEYEKEINGGDWAQSD